MPILGVSVTKRYTWEGNQEDFSNVYYYNTEDGGPDLDIPAGISDSDAVALVEQIAEIERQIHGSDIEFVRGRVWGPVDGTPSENQTIAKVDLALQGSGSIDSYLSLEDCILVRVKTGRLSVRDRPVWLRKWFRTMRNPAAADGSFGSLQHRREEPMDQDTIDEVRAVMANLVVLNLVELTSFPDRLILSSPSGRRPVDLDDPEMQVYPYLQTHDVKY